ncbi:hypothetical protein MPSEU_000466600 [Mayamaea pseudoterrestris]|nr:hypothetical protein MPSEU_000466600 [Mayamaea pseudoterrestris]
MIMSPDEVSSLHMHHDPLTVNTTINNESSFCQAGHMGGMIMYMDGFHFGLAGNQPCLNLFLASWTLDTRFKFMAAILAVFCLAMLVAASSRIREKLTRRLSQMQASRVRRNARIIFILHRMAGPTMHATQALLGYLLMLATMTFSVELLLAVVIGLGAGHAMFVPVEHGANDGMYAAQVASDPCCQFLNHRNDSGEEHEIPGTSRGEASMLLTERLSDVDPLLPRGGSDRGL